MAERAPGFYWVRLLECVDDIARWSDGEDDDRPTTHFFWSLTGDETPYQDNDFAEIGERVAPKDALLLLGAATRSLSLSMRLERQLLALLTELRTEYIGEVPPPELLAVIDAVIELGERIKPMPDLTEFMENKNG